MIEGFAWMPLFTVGRRDREKRLSSEKDKRRMWIKWLRITQFDKTIKTNMWLR